MITIAEVIEACAQECDTEWNGDSDTYEASLAANDCAAAIRTLKAKYEGCIVADRANGMMLRDDDNRCAFMYPAKEPTK
jgi:hypothetical protein